MIKKALRDKVVREVRKTLKKKGWKLILLSGQKIIKSDKCSGLCDETAKRITLATKKMSQRELLYILAHELAHFLQVRAFDAYTMKEVDSAYDDYNRIVQSKRFLPIDRWRKAREIVLEYEYDADIRAFDILKDWGVPTKTFRRDANAYNTIIRFTFHDGIQLRRGRKKFCEKLRLPDRWWTFEQRQSALRKGQLAYLRGLQRHKSLL